MMLFRQDPPPPPPAWPKLDTLAVAQGKVLAQKYCVGCHSFPDPELLDKSTWMLQVLPAMGPYLGISGYQTDIYPDLRNAENQRSFPSKPLLTTSEWEQLMAWYYQEAPAALESFSRTEIQLGLPGFRAEYFGKSSQWPVTTLLLVDTAEKIIWRGDAAGGHLIRYGLNFNPIDTVLTGGAPVQLRKTAEGYLLLKMGGLEPADERAGQLLFFPDSLRPTSTPETWLDSLRRPRYFLYQNLDQRFGPDLLVANAGNLVGNLQLELAKRRSDFQHSVLGKTPGALQVEVVYANADTLPDLLVLMGQSHEGILLYLNEGKGRFKEKQVLSFPPTFGVSSMFVADFNDDCQPDILITQGDRGNFPPILKPYHGIRLFLNNGDFTFYPAFFYPQNGASHAIAFDADLDGDLDIASISRLPDLENSPEESFLLLIQEKPLQFSPFTFERIPSGKWGTLTAEDIDQDGDLDILIGNSMWRVERTPEWISERWTKSTPAVVLLRNQAHAVKKQRKWFWQ